MDGRVRLKGEADWDPLGGALPSLPKGNLIFLRPGDTLPGSDFLSRQRMFPDLPVLPADPGKILPLTLYRRPAETPVT